MATCTYCGESTVDYVEYARGNVFCSPEHRIYNEKKDNVYDNRGDTRTTEERNCASGESNAGYIWKPTGDYTAFSPGNCAYCNTKPSSYVEHFQGKVYCSSAHRKYHQIKLGLVTGTLKTQEKNSHSSGSHSGYNYHN